MSVTEVARNLADFLNRVAYRGERFILMRGGRDVAELRPVVSGLRLAELPGLIERLPHLTAAEALDFATDLDTARGEIAALPDRDPWAS